MLVSRRRMQKERQSDLPSDLPAAASKNYPMSRSNNENELNNKGGPLENTPAPDSMCSRQNLERTQLLSKTSSVCSYDSNLSEDDSISSEKNSMNLSSPSIRGGTRAEPWMQRAWTVHFVIGTVVLLYSVWANGGSKYIPVDPSRSSVVSGMEELKECQKLFINIMASSPDDLDAVICCSMDNSSGDSENGLMDTLFALCPPYTNNETPAPTYLPFLGRLAKFPDAWLIPLFPLLLRIAFRTYQTVLENGHLVLDTTFGVYSFRRLVFYFFLMQFRGWVLYFALNAIEDSFSSSPPKETQGADDKPCWYQEWLQDSQPHCHGRAFDFSDHVVLYYAQLLPIAFLEYLHSVNRPYWPFHCFRRVALPFLLTLGMMYLYFITFVGVYKTAAYFHTPSESLAGYAVSLVALVPLCVFQCSNRIGAMFALREYFFGPKTKVLFQ